MQNVICRPSEKLKDAPPTGRSLNQNWNDLEHRPMLLGRTVAFAVCACWLLSPSARRLLEQACSGVAATEQTGEGNAGSTPPRSPQSR